MLRQYILLQHMLRTRRDERGATAVEYGLLVVLIAAIIVAAVATLGQTVLGGFQDTNTGMGGTAPAA